MDRAVAGVADRTDDVAQPIKPAVSRAAVVSPGRTVAAAAIIGSAAAVGAVAWSRRPGDGPPVGAAPPFGSATVFGVDPELHLARRATFGLTPTLVGQIRAAGAQDWLAAQLDPASIADDDLDELLEQFPLARADAAELAALTTPDQRRSASSQLVQATLARQLWSRRQLFEVMVDFWSNHFNVTTPFALTATTKPVEDRAVIRAHALGSFEDLLLADAKSPPMLLYLGNDLSRGDAPNENYGRELLELHTVGVDGGYTEDDVANSAKVLTGRTVDRTTGRYLFAPEFHYTGAVSVLGWSSANDSAVAGEEVGQDYLRYLSRHEQTALHLSTKLAIRFVSDDPPAALVQRLARTFLAAGTAVVPWLRELFESAEFAAASGRKTRRPLEDLIATARTLGITAGPSARVGLSKLLSRAAALGQTPMGFVPPTGYPDVAAAWHSTSGLVNRWNLHRDLVAGTIDGLEYRAVADLLDDPQSAQQAMAQLEFALTGQVFRSDHRAALLTYAGVDTDGGYDEHLITALPELAALVLASPYHLTR